MATAKANAATKETAMAKRKLLPSRTQATEARQLATTPPPQPSVDAPALQVSFDQRYGRKRYYPENELARTFAELAKREKHLTDEDVAIIKRLGYRILVVVKPSEPTEL